MQMSVWKHYIQCSFKVYNKYSFLKCSFSQGLLYFVALFVIN